MDDFGHQTVVDNICKNDFDDHSFPNGTDGALCADETVDALFGNSPLCYVGFDREELSIALMFCLRTLHCVDVLFKNSPLR
ncbi:hypothetical protein L1987_79410 [Smallanthus sonchifolius]|uniref:Uncharacterized protein n=1 Tax=Smallanthus sonchifolius TaxID=185202 RepID=A0ACB8ZF87_9ASTR|nr:hypothetical protein L1987_79410 [Smallanthus sonchifolius]